MIKSRDQMCGISRKHEENEKYNILVRKPQRERLLEI
jgi:hypothetical protein